MATLTIKNIPDDLYEAFKQVARKNHRSINGEVIFWLERAVNMQPLPADEMEAEARILREMTAHYVVDDETLTSWKQEGRE
jgi:plasmid stability protein